MFSVFLPSLVDQRALLYHTRAYQASAQVKAPSHETAPRNSSTRTASPNWGIIYSYVGLSELCSLILQSALGLSANGELFSVNFFRIFLDEAHVIKNRRSNSIQTAVSCEF